MAGRDDSITIDTEVDTSGFDDGIGRMERRAGRFERTISGIFGRIRNRARDSARPRDMERGTRRASSDSMWGNEEDYGSEESGTGGGRGGSRLGSIARRRRAARERTASRTRGSGGDSDDDWGIGGRDDDSDGMFTPYEGYDPWDNDDGPESFDDFRRRTGRERRENYEIGSQRGPIGKVRDYVAIISEAMKAEGGFIGKLGAMREMFGEYKQEIAARDAAEGRTPKSKKKKTFGDVMKDVGKVIGTVTKAFGAVGKGFGKMMSPFIKAPYKAVGALGKGIVSFGKGLNSIDKKGIGLIGKGIGAIYRGVKGIGKGKGDVKDLVKQMTSFKTILTQKIKGNIVNWMQQGMEDGMKRLARYDKQFNASMTSMMHSAQELGGNLTVAFSNIIKVIEPVLTKVIQLISQAVEYFNKFMSAISGSGTYTKATARAKSFANTMGGMQRQLMGFDEINKLNAQGGGSITYGEENIESWIKGITDKLKQLWIEGKYEELGNFIAENLNKAMDKVDEFLDSIAPKVNMWAKNLGKILSGIIEKVNWKKLGTLVAKKSKIILDALNNFFKQINFKTVGAGFAQFISGYFDTGIIDSVAELIGTALNGISDAIEGFVENMDWNGIADKFKKGISKIFGTKDSGGIVDWKNMGKNIGNLLSDALDTVQSIFEDRAFWNSLATSFSEFLAGVFKPGNIAKAIVNIATMKTTIWGMITNILSDINWAQLGVELSTGINTVFDGDLLNTAATLFTTCVNGITTTLSNFIFSAKWGNWGRSFKGSLLKIFGTEDEGGLINWESLGDNIKGAISGITTFLTESVFDSSFWESALTGITDAINAIFSGDAGESGTVSDSLTKLVSSGLNVTQTIIGAIGKIKWSDIAKQFSASINNIFKNDGSKGTVNWNELGQTIGDSLISVLEGLGDFITETDWSKVGEALGNMLGNIDWKKLAETIWSLLCSALQGAWDMVSSFVTSLWNGIFGDTSQKLAEQTKESVNETLKESGAEVKNLGKESYNLWRLYGEENIAGIQAAFNEEGKALTEEELKLFESLKKINITNTSFNQSETIIGFLELAGAEIGDYREYLIGQIGESKKDLVAAAMLLSNGITAEMIMGLGGLDEAQRIFAECLEATGDDYVAALELMKQKTAEFSGEAGKYLDGTSPEEGANEAGKSTAEGVAEGIESGEKEVEEATSGIVKSATVDGDKLESENEKEAEKLMAGIAAAIELGNPAATQAVSKASDAIVDSVEEKLNSEKGYSIGHNMMVGLQNGMVEMQQSLMTTAGIIAQGLYDSFCIVLKIASPSKKFSEIGKYTMMGLENGINGEKSNVLGTISDMAKSIVKEMEKGVDGIGNGGVDNVIVKLSELAESFVAIADALNDIGKVSIPDIANGNVVPYRVKVSDQSSTDIASAVKDAISSAIEGTSMGISDVNVNVYLDGKQITDVVTKYQKRNNRALGVS